MSKTTNDEKKRVARYPFITFGAVLSGGISIALIVLVLLFFIIIPGRHNARKNCQAALDVRDAVVLILLDAKSQTPPSAKSNDFYHRAQSKLNNVKCRN